MSAAPSASGRYGGSGVVMPNRFVISTTVLMPTFSASFTAGTLREPPIAQRREMGPSNFSPQFRGGWGWAPLVVVNGEQTRGSTGGGALSSAPWQQGSFT